MALAKRISDRLQFAVERLLAGGPFGQLLVAWAAVAFAAMLGGLVMFWLSSSGNGIGQELWWSFLRLTDPGYLGDDEGLLRRLVSTLLTVAGYVLFMGTLVAIMTQWLFRQMRQFELGQTPVSFRQHTVLLGWSSRTLAVINELLSPMIPQQEINKIAVLADDITQGPSAELQAEPIPRRKKQRIVLRSGSLLNPEHLQRVAVADARTIVIPSRGNSAEQSLSADAEVIKVLLSLQAELQRVGAKQLPPRVVAELQDARKVPIALHTYRGALQVVASDLIIARIILRSVLYPGLSGVANALLIDAAQPQFIPISAQVFAGRTWQYIQQVASTVTPCGVLRKQAADGGVLRRTLLAPAADFVIQASDEILYLAESVSDIHQLQRTTTTALLPASAKALVVPPRVLTRQVLILGWSNKVLALLNEMAADKRTQFTVLNVSTAPVAERQQAFNEHLPNAAQTLPIQWRQADYTAQTVMQQLQPEGYDSVILFSSDRVVSGEEADARSIVAFMVLDYLLAQSSATKRPHIMVELHDSSNASYVNHHHNEVLVSSVVISHVLAQVAVYPQLRVVYEELLSAEGSRLALRRLPVDCHGVISIRNLRAMAVQAKAVLLGYQNGNGTILNPSLESTVMVTADTQLIVLQG